MENEVIVKVVRVRGLPKVDTFGSADPYVCVTLLDASYCGAQAEAITHNVSKSRREEHTAKGSGIFKINAQRCTRTINNQLSPLFDEQFQFTETATTPSSTSKRIDGGDVALLVSVHDWNRIGADKLLGQTIVRVACGPPDDRWHALLSESGAEVHGRDGPAQILLHISYKWSGRAPVSLTRDMTSPGTAAPNGALVVEDQEHVMLRTRLKQEQELVDELRKSVAEERQATDALKKKLADSTRAGEDKAEQLMRENKRLTVEVEQLRDSLKKERQEGFWREAARKSESCASDELEEAKTMVDKTRKEHEELKASFAKHTRDTEKLHCELAAARAMIAELEERAKVEEALAAKERDMAREKEGEKQRDRDRETERKLEEVRVALQAAREREQREHAGSEELKKKLSEERAQVEGLEWRLTSVEDELERMKAKYEGDKIEWERTLRGERKAREDSEGSTSAVRAMEGQLAVLKERADRDRRDAEVHRDAAREERQVAEGLRAELMDERRKATSLRIMLAEERQNAQALERALKEGNECAAGLRMSLREHQGLVSELMSTLRDEAPHLRPRSETKDAAPVQQLAKRLSSPAQLQHRRQTMEESHKGTTCTPRADAGGEGKEDGLRQLLSTFEERSGTFNMIKAMERRLDATLSQLRTPRQTEADTRQHNTQVVELRAGGGGRVRGSQGAGWAAVIDETERRLREDRALGEDVRRRAGMANS